MPRVRQFSSVADIEGRMNTITRGIKHSTIRFRNVLHEKSFINYFAGRQVPIFSYFSQHTPIFPIF